MDTRQICKDVARDLIRFGALSSNTLLDLQIENDAIRRDWLDRFTREAAAALERLQPRIERLTESSPEINNRIFFEITVALLQDFRSTSLRTARPSLAATLLLYQRILSFLKNSLTELALVSHALNLAEQADQCDYLARQISAPALRTRPFTDPRYYQRHLRVFAQLELAPDPMAQLKVVRPPARVAFQDFERPRLSGGRAFGDSHDAAPITMEISTPVLSASVLDKEQPLADRIYRVWFGTNRVPAQPTDPGQGFTGVVDTHLHLGSCLVFVPQSHEVGSIGSNWILRTFVLRADDRLDLKAIRALDPDAFQKGIAAEIASRPQGRSALVFVHGFNVSFENAARRAAQLACDLTVDGVTAFFSWPSPGGVANYSHDEESVRVSTKPFLEFLRTLLEVSGLERVDIIAHSMGNRLIAAAMSQLAASAKRERLGHLVLAAPDIGRVEFNPLVVDYKSVATKSVTLYSSGRDKALWASSRKHRYLRVGDEPPIYLHTGIDTISASGVRADWLGHGYFAATKPLIADLKQLLWAGLTPMQRGLIALPDAATPEYWLLKAR